MTEDVTVRVSPESFAAIRDGLRELFRPDSGRKGISSILSKEEGIYAPDEMIVGVKLQCEWKKGIANVYVYRRRKPKVKATWSDYLGRASSMAEEPSRLVLSIEQSENDDFMPEELRTPAHIIIRKAEA